VGQTRYLLQLHADADAAAALVEVLSGSAEQVVAPDIEQEAVSEALNLIGGRLAGVSQRDAEPVTLGTPLSVRGITTAKALWSIECAVCGGRMRFELYPT
jgi:chemotaxis protein CheY-P-specific phosphatase CheC